MKSLKLETQLDDLLEEFVLENLEWPESDEELDKFLSTCVDDPAEQ
jgi:hypothetical protein